MTWEPRPLPPVTPETERFWAAAADGDLLLRECQQCGLVYYYPRALCPDCLSDDVAWTPADGTGVVYSFSVMEDVVGWPDDELPLVVAYVELDEGPRVITNLVDCDPDDVDIGTRVGLETVPTDESDVGIPVFRPLD